MTELALVAALVTALAVGVVALALFSWLDPARRQVLANLHRGRSVATPVHPADEDASSGRSAIEGLARRVTPGPVIRVLTRQHVLAGRPPAWAPERLLVLKLLWVPTGAGLAVLAARTEQPPLILALAVVVVIVVYFLPELLLYSRGMERNEAIQQELADTLDQMTISVEAGLGFDAAMSLAARNGKGPLAEELKRTFQDIQIGRSRRQAFEALTERTTVVDLRRFVRAVIQADAYGISISDVLRTQASEMRLKRRQRAEETAQKIPVKVLMPLMLCILPVLFIVVLGPAVMNMVVAFGNM